MHVSRYAGDAGATAMVVTTGGFDNLHLIGLCIGRMLKGRE